MSKELRLEAFSKELNEASELFKRAKNIAITGVYKSGPMNLVKLLFEIHQKEFDAVIYDDDFIEFSEILTKVSNAKGKILITVPSFSQKSKEFKENFLKLLNTSQQRIYSIITLSVYDYKNPQDILKLNIKGIREMLILKPRNKKETSLLASEYISIDNNPELVDQIFQLSGGLPGLIKSVALYISRYKKFDLRDFLDDEKEMFVLSGVYNDYKLLSEQERIEFGICNPNGEIISELLAYYSKDNNESEESTVQSLIRFFIKNKGQLITIEQIDKLTNKNAEFTIWNRYKLIERIRNDLDKRYTLITIRNKGYKLIDD